MSLNSGSFDKKLYEARNQEAIRQAKEMIENAQEWGEKPVSDKEFQRLAEENLKNKWNSLEWWQFITRTRMYVWRKKLLAQEIKRLKEESHEESLNQAKNLMLELNEWENEWENGLNPKINIQVDSDRTPISFNTFRKK